MKAVCYLRIAKGPRGFKFNATTKANRDPIKGSGYQADSLPTRMIKLRLDLPDDLFGPDATVDVEIPSTAVQVLIEAAEPEPVEDEAA